MDTDDPYSDAPVRPGSPGSEDTADEAVVDLGDADSAVPPVVAVIVAHDPGPGFEDVLRSFADQDYPALSVLVVDAGSSRDQSPRVAAVLPDAYIRRVPDNPGYAAAANEVLQVVDGAAFFLLCHDDAALAPDAVRLLVEEAYRSNAGVVGPKLVQWDDPTRLLQVGLLIDKTGYPLAPVEPGELDQEQHDAVHDVFCVPGAVTLVRADLFSALGGYDPAISVLGEDLDLCWRAQVAGARVLVAPAAVARHVQALDRRPGFSPDRRRALALRHRLRTVLTCYGRWHRLRVLPQAAVFAVGEMLYVFVAGHRRVAGDIAGAWRWNWRNRRDIVAARRRLASVRTVSDHDVRRLQIRGSARITAFLRGQVGAGEDRVRSLRRSADDVAEVLRHGPRRVAVVAWVVLAAVLVVGSRQYLVGHDPSLLDLPPLPTRPWPLLAEWLSGWRDAGLGSEAPAPTAFGLLGVAGSFLLGAMALLRTLLIAVPLAAGPIGVARIAGASGSRRAGWVAAVAYAAMPVPYNALAEGRWGGLVLWGATPWILARLVAASRDEPFQAALVGGWRSRLGLGLLLAVVVALVPIGIVLPTLLAVAVVVGGVVAGRLRGAGRVLSLAVSGTLVGIALHLPWTLDFVVPDATWAALGGVTPAGPSPSVAALLRFESGPLGAAPLGWAFLVAAALPLVIGRAWRFGWAVRYWFVALAGFALAFAGGLDDLPVSAGPIELGLAPAACGLALATALGVVAFEVDLPGYRFGWHQLLALGSACALVLGCVPALVGALGGRWEAPNEGVRGVLSFLDEEQETAGPFRTLWLGDPAVLPLAGWELRKGVAWATTDDGNPNVLDRWPGSPDGTTRLVADAVNLAVGNETSRLGRLLAPMAVRYVVVVEADAPLADPTQRRLAPPELIDAFGAQLDLSEVEVDAGLHVFRNTAWFPARARLQSGEDVSAADGYFAAAHASDFGDAPAVLRDVDGYTRFEGAFPGPGELWWSASSSPNWSLDVAGEAAPRREAFGWGNAFTVEADGDATLSYSTPIYRQLVLAVQAALWTFCALTLARARRRDRATAESRRMTGVTV
ncbi:MAG: glycosyltransferase [Acidimicrobiales bacterium]